MDNDPTKTDTALAGMAAPARAGALTDPGDDRAGDRAEPSEPREGTADNWRKRFLAVENAIIDFHYNGQRARYAAEHGVALTDD